MFTDGRPNEGKTTKISLLLYHFVGTGRAGKGVWFGLKDKAHAQDVAHGFLQSLIGLKLGVCVDVGMHLQSYIVSIQHIAKGIGYLYRAGHLGDHPLAQGHFALCVVVADEHKTTAFFAQEYHYGSKLNMFAPHLRVGTDTNFHAMAGGQLSFEGTLYGLCQRLFNTLAIQAAPFHVSIVEG